VDLFGVQQDRDSLDEEFGKLMRHTAPRVLVCTMLPALLFFFAVLVEPCFSDLPAESTKGFRRGNVEADRGP